MLNRTLNLDYKCINATNLGVGLTLVWVCIMHESEWFKSLLNNQFFFALGKGKKEKKLGKNYVLCTFDNGSICTTSKLIWSIAIGSPHAHIDKYQNVLLYETRPNNKIIFFFWVRCLCLQNCCCNYMYVLCYYYVFVFGLVFSRALFCFVHSLKMS